MPEQPNKVQSDANAPNSTRVGVGAARAEIRDNPTAAPPTPAASQARSGGPADANPVPQSGERWEVRENFTVAMPLPVPPPPGLRAPVPVRPAMRSLNITPLNNPVSPESHPLRISSASKSISQVLQKVDPELEVFAPDEKAALLALYSLLEKLVSSNTTPIGVDALGLYELLSEYFVAALVGPLGMLGDCESPTWFPDCLLAEKLSDFKLKLELTKSSLETYKVPPSKLPKKAEILHRLDLTLKDTIPVFKKAVLRGSLSTKLAALMTVGGSPPDRGGDQTIDTPLGPLRVYRLDAKKLDAAGVEIGGVFQSPFLFRLMRRRAVPVRFVQFVKEHFTYYAEKEIAGKIYTWKRIRKFGRFHCDPWGDPSRIPLRVKRVYYEKPWYPDQGPGIKPKDYWLFDAPGMGSHGGHEFFALEHMFAVAKTMHLSIHLLQEFRTWLIQLIPYKVLGCVLWSNVNHYALGVPAGTLGPSPPPPGPFSISAVKWVDGATGYADDIASIDLPPDKMIETYYDGELVVMEEEK